MFSNVFLLNDYIDTKSRMIYLIANSSSITLKENLLTESLFLNSEAESINEITFDDWKNVVSPFQNEKKESVKNEKSSTLLLVKSILNPHGFINPKLSFKGTFINISGQTGVVLSSDSYLELEPSFLFLNFLPDSRYNYILENIDQGKFEKENKGVKYFEENTIDSDFKNGRIYSPTFYFKFLFTEQSTFPIILFMRGDIRLKNSLAVVLVKNEENKKNEFFISTFVRDSKSKLVKNESTIAFQTNKIHSLSVTYLQLLGSYAQIILIADDGQKMEGRALIKDFYIENTEEKISFFTQDNNLIKILNKEMSEKATKLGSPGYGSILFQFSHLNSGSGVISNNIFGANFDYLQNCLATCPLNFSFDPLQVSSSNPSSNEIESPFYQSNTCLSCNTTFQYYNWVGLPFSLNQPETLPKLIDNADPVKCKKILHSLIISFKPNIRFKKNLFYQIIIRK